MGAGSGARTLTAGAGPLPVAGASAVTVLAVFFSVYIEPFAISKGKKRKLYK